MRNKIKTKWLKKTQLLVYGFLVLIIFSTGCKIKQYTIEGQNAGSQALYINVKDNPTIFTTIGSPTCTGCKNSLANFLNKLPNKYNQVLVIENCNNVLGNKLLANSLKKLFVKTDYVIFSKNLEEKYCSFVFKGDTLYSGAKYTPSQIWFKDGLQISLSYQTIFNDLELSDFYYKCFKDFF